MINYRYVLCFIYILLLVSQNAERRQRKANNCANIRHYYLNGCVLMPYCCHPFDCGEDKSTRMALFCTFVSDFLGKTLLFIPL